MKTLVDKRMNEYINRYNGEISQSINETITDAVALNEQSSACDVCVAVQTGAVQTQFTRFQGVLTAVTLLTSLASPVTANPVLCDVFPADVTRPSPEVVSLYQDADNASGVQGARAGSRDSAVCHSLLPAGGLNLRSSCPWHYVEERQGHRFPRTILRAQLTCGERCLKMHNGLKLNSSKLCLPVHRYVSVLECFTSACGQRCCHKLLPVPVAYTCAFGRPWRQ